MIPILFNKDEKTFTSLGLGQMDATLVEVERERNGNYTLYAEVPFNSPQAKHLTKEMLIKADAGSRTKWQTFKINRTIKDTNADVIKVYADHISMDTINDAMKPKVVIRQQTAEGALRQWANSLVSGKTYDVQSDITHVGSTEWTIDEVENARQALGGVSGSILDVWGGEYEFDNNTIILHKEMGRTAPTVLEYGRNIVSLEYEELIDGVYTSIYPYATYTPKSEDNKQLPDIMVTLDELIVDSEYAGNYETRRIQIVDFSNEFDSNAENPEIPTQDKLRTLAKAYVKNNGYGIPKISQEIDFVDLSKTLDYQDIQVMEEIELNDRVPVYYPNIDAETNDVKVTTTNWDVLNNRYSKITLSTIGAMNTNSITSKLNTAIKDLKAEQKKINNTVPYLLNGQGNRVWHTTPDENMEHKIDDTWFKKNGKYTIIYKWNGSMWEEVLNDETFITEIEAEVATAQAEAEKASQSAKDADTRAGTAIEKAGANANLLTTHQNTLNTINNTTIPNVNKVASDAMAEAKSALSSASSAMDEAKKADVKIADYVTKNGLVNGTTVDTKINDATGEINKKITTVESKVDGLQVGGRNLILDSGKEISNSAYILTQYKISDTSLVEVGEDYTIYIVGELSEGQSGWFLNLQHKTSNGTLSYPGMVSVYEDSKVGNNVWMNTFKMPSIVSVENLTGIINLYTYALGDGKTSKISKIKLVKGNMPITDWTPAPEDNLSQSEFQIFENTYSEDVKGINSTLADLSTKKLDSTTYTNFYNNEYKQTAQGVTDAWTAVNKIIDANGNSTDSFAKAVYDRNATRQAADFKLVTNGLVKTSTYEAGIDGVSKSISTLQENLQTKVTQADIDASILSDKTVKDTRNTNELPSYYQANYPRQEVKEFKTNSVIGINEAGFSLVTTEVPWTGSNGGSIKQTARTNNDMYIRRGHADQTQWTAWEKVADTTYVNTKITEEAGLIRTELSDYAKKVDLNGYATTQKVNTLEQSVNGNISTISSIKTNPASEIAGYSDLAKKSEIPTDYVKTTNFNQTVETALGNSQIIASLATKTDINGIVKTTDSEYQRINTTSKLYERVIGSTDAEINTKVARMVMTDSIFQTEIATAKSSGLNLIDRTTESQGYMSGVTGNGVLTGDLAERSRYARVKNIQGGQVYTLAKQSDMASDADQFRLSWRGSDGYTVISSLSVQGDVSTVTAPTIAKELVISYPRDSEVKMEIGSTFTGFALTPGLTSKITQTANSWAMELKDGNDLKTAINATTSTLRLKSDLLHLDAGTTVAQAFWAKEVNAIKVNADNITTGTLDAIKVTVTNLDANNITSNKTSFIQSNWNDIESSIRIDGRGLLSTASDGSQVYLQDGIVGARNPNGATIGQIGYAYQTESPWYSMQISHGSHFQIRMDRAKGELNKQAFYIISGGTESYLNTDNIYLNPASSGRVRVQGAMTVDKDLRTDGAILVRSRLEYLNGGYIESQAANSNILINATNKLIIYTNGTNALEFDANNAVFRRKISDNSDIRLKTNIVDMPINSLEAIRNIEIKKFDYLDGRTNYYGIIAQQAQQYLPELINTDSEGYLMVDKSAMTYVNMHAIQQLDSKVDVVDNEVSKLKAQIASLQDELAQLKGA